MTCELICTGWYSTEEPRSYLAIGDDLIRSKEFRALWWKSIDTFVQPHQVLVVDSNSPIKPNDCLFTSTPVKTIELIKNPGHSQNCTVHYCGWTASLVLGMEYALFNDVDLFIYVEQDALIYGDGFVDRIKESLKKNDLVFGNGGKYHDVETSILAANKKGIRKFLAALHSINYTDKQLAPEFKLMYSASKLRHLHLAGLTSWDKPKHIRRAFTLLLQRLFPLMREYELLPFGYGRARPINFADDLFYFQHGNAEEIEIYSKKIGY